MTDVSALSQPYLRFDLFDQIRNFWLQLATAKIVTGEVMYILAIWLSGTVTMHFMLTNILIFITIT